jgi:hypothetical protein
MSRLLLQLLSWAALAGSIVPPALYLVGRLELPAVKWAMLIATLVWFVATPLWMGHPKQEEPLVP